MLQGWSLRRESLPCVSETESKDLNVVVMSATIVCFASTKKKEAITASKPESTKNFSKFFGEFEGYFSKKVPLKKTSYHLLLASISFILFS